MELIQPQPVRELESSSIYTFGRSFTLVSASWSADIGSKTAKLGDVVEKQMNVYDMHLEAGPHVCTCGRSKSAWGRCTGSQVDLLIPGVPCSDLSNVVWTVGGSSSHSHTLYIHTHIRFSLHLTYKHITSAKGRHFKIQGGFLVSPTLAAV